ncbi:TetR/AcrR family transcriptional regulator [Mesorhizobium sp. BAC0120]|uniref:TetR/AcrR family transcriptional regulator n=1 Tax=Mesorhizobium sp. BAC0120 TaxID=3090670 RepID=UPI00298C26E1|nr:TetR/AcrR family transcriptional regulator [Mesorhizobium sp. BAC0120]MDW6020709.1 TetR/AcrR family transcriptional regulator [Mesorhizobium sp. BAC0120]
MTVMPAPGSHLAKRQSILDTAACVFCREGYGGTNIDMIACEAGVSRQTVYNHHGDKDSLFRAVVHEVTERVNHRVFETLATFPDQPRDLGADLAAFAVRFNKNCIYDRDGKFLRRLVDTEGERYPELFAEWREQGPGKTWAALAARFARLAHAGYLEIEDPDLVARQFLALINADFKVATLLGEMPSDEEIERSSANAVSMFLRAYACRPSGTAAARDKSALKA